jgi:predicted ATPase
MLAQHYSEAGLLADAVGYWQQAGQRALERSAYVEALGHLHQGLTLLEALPETPQRLQDEFVLQIAVGRALAATRGYAAPEVEQAYARARQLCQHVGDTAELFPALVGLATFCLIRTDLPTTYALGEQLVRLAQRTQRPAHLAEAHRMLGTALLYRGELDTATAHLQQSLAFPPVQSHQGALDTGVAALTYMALGLWLRGYPDQALQSIGQALTQAKRLSHPLSLAFALYGAAQLHQMRRAADMTLAYAQQLHTLAGEQGLPFWQATGAILHGWALAFQGHGEESLRQVRQGFAAYQTTGADLGRPYVLAILAEAYGRAGQPERALRALDEALAAAHHSAERYFEAEVYRLRGELWWWQARQDLGSGLATLRLKEAEESLQRALAVARRQAAKSLELRVAMSISCIWQTQGRQADSRLLLSEIVAGFSEGFDTADLQEARGFLAALA